MGGGGALLGCPGVLLLGAQAQAVWVSPRHGASGLPVDLGLAERVSLSVSGDAAGAEEWRLALVDVSLVEIIWFDGLVVVVVGLVWGVGVGCCSLVGLCGFVVAAAAVVVVVVAVVWVVLGGVVVLGDFFRPLFPSHLPKKSNEPIRLALSCLVLDLARGEQHIRVVARDTSRRTTVLQRQCYTA